MNGKKATQSHISNRLTYAHLRKIKRWMFCPACRSGKMTVNKSSAYWTCEECGYQLSAGLLKNQYVFWFCDQCGSYLNIQEGFDYNVRRHLCTKCGYENDTTADNLKGICADCGKALPDPDSTLCADCLLIRRQAAKERAVKVIQAIGLTAAAASKTYLASQPHSSEKFPLFDNIVIEAGEKINEFDFMTNEWLETASEDELRILAKGMESFMDQLDYDSEEYAKIYDIHTDVVNAIAQRFPLNLPYREHGWYLPNNN